MVLQLRTYLLLSKDKEHSFIFQHPLASNLYSLVSHAKSIFSRGWTLNLKLLLLNGGTTILSTSYLKWKWIAYQDGVFIRYPKNV